MFAEPLTNLDYYWIGYLRADGSIVCRTKDVGSIRFGQTQLQPVQELKNYSKTNGKLHVYERAGGFASANKAYVIIIGKAEIYKRAVELGVKKTLREDIYLNKHFWRGMIDGDGSLGLYHRDGQDYASISLCSPQTYDLEKFADYAKSLGLRRPIIHPSRTLFITRLSPQESKYMVWHLYHNEYSANLLKLEKLKKILEWQPDTQRSKRLSLKQWQEMGFRL